MKIAMYLYAKTIAKKKSEKNDRDDTYTFPSIE